MVVKAVETRLNIALNKPRTVNPAHRNMAGRIFYYKAKNDKVWNTLSAEEQKERARILRQMRAQQDIGEDGTDARPLRRAGVGFMVFPLFHISAMLMTS